MQVERRYSFLKTVLWTKKYVFIFALWAAIPVTLYHFFEFEWMLIPWQPLALIGTAVAFYLGFKNNAAYDRTWEARKIWGGIVNSSRSFTLMARDFVNNDESDETLSEEELTSTRKQIVHRHVAWLRALALEMRKKKSWEHNTNHTNKTRDILGSHYSDEKLIEEVKSYLSEEELNHILSKGNRSSHLLSLQSKHLMKLRQAGVIEHFRHLEMQGLLTEFYTLQGKSERIKNFPFPRQYASVNYFFVVLFVIFLPFGMLNIFAGLTGDFWIWVAIPATVLVSWVFWVMEMIGDYSENPFEGLYNDVPISSLARGIEIDIRQMLDEEDLPPPITADDEHHIVM